MVVLLGGPRGGAASSSARSPPAPRTTSRKVHEISRSMVTEYGMGTELASKQLPADDYSMSDHTRRMVDEEQQYLTDLAHRARAELVGDEPRRCSRRSPTRCSRTRCSSARTSSACMAAPAAAQAAPLHGGRAGAGRGAERRALAAVASAARAPCSPAACSAHRPHRRRGRGPRRRHRSSTRERLGMPVAAPRDRRGAGRRGGAARRRREPRRAAARRSARTRPSASSSSAAAPACTTWRTGPTTSSRRWRRASGRAAADRRAAAHRHPRQPRGVPAPEVDRRGADRDRRARGGALMADDDAGASTSASRAARCCPRA